jgi:hypothetical protein
MNGQNHKPNTVVPDAQEVKYNPKEQKVVDAAIQASLDAFRLRTAGFRPDLGCFLGPDGKTATPLCRFSSGVEIKNTSSGQCMDVPVAIYVAVGEFGIDFIDRAVEAAVVAERIVNSVPGLREQMEQDARLDAEERLVQEARKHRT